MVVIAISEELDNSTANIQIVREVQVSTLAGLVRTRGRSHWKTDMVSPNVLLKSQISPDHDY